MPVPSRDELLDASVSDGQSQDGKEPEFIEYMRTQNRARATCVTFSRDNRLVVIGYSVKSMILTGLKLYELEGGIFKEKWRYSRLEDAVSAVQISPDG